VFLHACVIALFLISFRHRQPDQSLDQTGVSVVYDNGAQSAQGPRQAQIPAPAETPPAAAPPPPQTAQAQPDVNLNLPQNSLAPLPEPVPQPLPQAAASPAKSARAKPAKPTRQYMVMNDMSFGKPAPRLPVKPNGLDLSLPQSDAQAVNSPEISIQGNVGADWEAGFNKWVYAHLYYPDSAAEQGQQGTVTVEFTAHRDGSVTGLRMTDSSGSPFLDQAWLGIFAENQLPKFPPGGSDTLKIKATVHYEIIK